VLPSATAELIDLVDCFPTRRSSPIILAAWSGRALQVELRRGHARWRKTSARWASGRILHEGRRDDHASFSDSTSTDRRDLPPTSADSPKPWKPLRRNLHRGFRSDRVMFGEQLPVDKTGTSYRVLWNAFKRIAAGYSPSEKADLFAGRRSGPIGCPRNWAARGCVDGFPSRSSRQGKNLGDARAGPKMLLRSPAAVDSGAASLQPLHPGRPAPAFAGKPPGWESFDLARTYPAFSQVGRNLLSYTQRATSIDTALQFAREGKGLLRYHRR